MGRFIEVRASLTRDKRTRLKPNGSLNHHMKYQVIVVSAIKSIGTDFKRACEELAERVNEQARWDLAPQGGPAVGETQSPKQPFIMEGMVKD